MNKRDNRTHRMVALAMMGAIVVLLANTPLGLIQLPVIKATTVHIPVILGAILLGPPPDVRWALCSASARSSAIPSHPL